MAPLHLSGKNSVESASVAPAAGREAQWWRAQLPPCPPLDSPNAWKYKTWCSFPFSNLVESSVPLMSSSRSLSDWERWKKKSFVERLNLERGLCVMIKNEMGPMWARFIERNEEMFCCLRSAWCYRWFMWCVASVMVLMAKHALSSKHLHLNVFIIEGAHKWTLTQIHSYGNIHSCLQICVGVNEYM